MSRRRYVIAYDMSDDRRRTQVFETLRGWGDHAQFSVFLCELTRIEKVTLLSSLARHIHHGEDQILILDVGHVKNELELSLETLGKAYRPNTPTMII